VKLGQVAEAQADEASNWSGVVASAFWQPELARSSIHEPDNVYTQRRHVSGAELDDLGPFAKLRTDTASRGLIKSG
jgi:hypothetical protein